MIMAWGALILLFTGLPLPAHAMTRTIFGAVEGRRIDGILRVAHEPLLRSALIPVVGFCDRCTAVATRA